MLILLIILCCCCICFPIIYGFIKRKDNALSGSIYNIKCAVSDESTINKLITRGAEAYLEYVLSHKNANLNQPMQFNDEGVLVPADPRICPTSNLVTSEQIVEPLSLSEESVYEPVADEPVAEPDNAEESVVEPDNAEESVVEEEITVEELRGDLEKEFELMGMSESSLKNLGIAIGIQLGIEMIGKGLAKKAGQLGGKAALKNITKSIAKKVVVKTQSKLLVKKLAGKAIKVASRGLSKLGAKLGVKGFMKLGIGVGKNALKSAFKSLGKSAAAVAAKSAAKGSASMGAKLAAKTGMGPVGWASMGFDVLSMGLDMGDAGGYMMLDTYKMIRDEIEKSMKKQFEGTDITYPYPIGPLDKIQEQAAAEYETKKFEKMKWYLTTPEGKVYFNKVKDDLLADNEYGSPDEKVADVLVTLSDQDALEFESKVISLLCKDLKGTLAENFCVWDDLFVQEQKKYENKIKGECLPDEDGNMKCSGPIGDFTKEYTDFMVSLYSDPNKTPEEIDKEGSDAYDRIYNKYINDEEVSIEAMKAWCDAEGGKQVEIDGEMKCLYKTKEQCDKHYVWDEDGFPEGTYAEWSSKLNMCYVAPYDIKKMCEENQMEYDPETGNCVITKELCKKKGAEYKEVNGKGDCFIPTGQEILEFIFGTTITRGLKQVFSMDQYEPCKPGETDDGYFCRKVECPSGYENRAGICYEKCGEGWKSDGTYGCYQNCPSGWKSTITHCQHNTKYSTVGTKGIADLACGNYTRNGKSIPYQEYAGLCYELPSQTKDSKWDNWTAGLGYVREKCPSGMGTFDPITNTCKHIYSRGVGIPVINECPEGYSNWGVLCKKKGFNVKTKNPNYVCPTKKQKVSPGYTGPDKNKTVKFKKDGLLCYPPCAKGYKEVGLTCVRTVKVKKYGQIGKPKKSCKNNKQYFNGLCYPKCPDGWHRRADDVEHCRQKINLKGFTDIGIGGYQKPRKGVKSKIPKIKIYAKKRKYKYSTKKN